MSDPSGRRTCDSDTCGGEQLPSHVPAAGNAPAGQAPAGNPPANPAPKKNSQGSGSFWDQAWKKASSGFHTAVNFAEAHKAEIAGAVVGIAVGAAVGAACLVATAGAGSIGCAMLAGAAGGAAGSMVTYALATPEKERSLGGLLVAGVVGAVVGAATVGIGAKVAPLVGAPARAVAGKIASAVLRTAEQKAVGSAAGSAAGGTARDVAAAGGGDVSQLLGQMRGVARLKAGFGTEGEPLIVDNSIGVNPQTVASTLRGAGYNARSVGEIFGRDPGDASIKGLADVANGRVIASDVGHDIGGGFGDRWIPVPGQIRTVDSILRLVRAA
jgi:hypothetical protein